MRSRYSFDHLLSTLDAITRFGAGLLLLVSAFTHATAHATPVSFAWDYGSSSQAGFAFHCGQKSGQYTLRFDAGNTDSYTISGLTEGATYYCAVAAYDSSGGESPYSNEISTVVPYSAPVAGFSASPTSGTVPLAVTFTNTTTGKVTAWSWDFGDTTSSTSQKPSHTYANPGSYTVKLTATGPGGSSTMTASAPITVTPRAPVANFSMTPTEGTAPLSVAFTDATTGVVTSWSWDFGDGNTSAVQSPSHTYASAGSYTVKLTATGPGGSSAKTASTPVRVIPPAPVANFTMTPTTGVAPLTVAFTDATTGDVTSWAWSFGDGATSSVQSPSHTYANPGNYTVKLTATGPGGNSTKTASTPISVAAPAPVASFAMTPMTGPATLTVSISNTTTGSVTSWSWDFGDGTGSTAKSPSHSYSNPGSYRVKLTATGPGGSSTKTAAAPVVVGPPPPPVANFVVRPSTGIAPLIVTFTNTTVGVVDSWEWDFGDGTRSSDVKSPAHLYTQPGNYTVKLTATNLGGTSVKTTATPITVNAPAVPVANFSMAPASGYAPLTVRFRNRTAGKVDSWLWDFGDNSTSTEANPSHVYTQAGSYTVKLSATNLAGTSTKTSVTPVAVTLPPLPVANFSTSPAGGYVPLTVRFINRTSGKVDSWSWDFGDGTTSSEMSPSHIYTQTGSYTVKLTAANLSGANTKIDARPIVVTLPPATFSVTPATGYAPLTVRFINRTPGKVDSWAWDFGDGNTSTEKNPTHIYAQVGNYTVTLSATNIGGTSTKASVTPIAVTLPQAPVASFGVTPASGTAPLSVRFINTTSGKVDSWAWDFGDGNASTQKSPIHVYAQVGNYTVKLSATNLGGTNTKTSVAPIAVTAPPAPVANFGITPGKGFAPLSVRFVNTTTGKVDSWAWDFGDGTASADKAPTHVYSAAGNYNVKLTATNQGGSSVKIGAVPIVVSMPPLPVANFSMTPASGFAALSVHFVNRSSGKVDSWLWDFGDGTTSTDVSPTHIYPQVGSYTVKLTATNLSGTNMKTTLRPLAATLPPVPVPRFTVSPASGYAPLTVRFTNRTPGKVDSWLWDFGDGTTSTQSNPTHVYTQVGNYTVKLSATNLNGTGTTTLAAPVRALRPGLVAAYGFEETSGTRVADLSGKGHTGVIFGATRVTSGKFGSALSFDGISNWVTVASSPSLNLTTGLTLEAWVNPSSSTSAWRDVIMKEQPAEAIYDLYADTGAGQPGGGVFMSAENIVSGGTALPANTWTHLATTYDGTNQILYVNGVQVASRAQSGAIKVSAGALRIGGDSIWGDYFQGLIDEVRVYNRALSASEIQADMTLGIAR